MEENNNKNEQNVTETKKGNNNKVLYVIIAILVIILLLLGLRSCGGNTPTSDNGNDIWDVTIDENAGDKTEVDYAAIQEELNKKVAETSINISMNTNPVCDGGTCSLMISNEEINNFMQVIEIYRDDTEELIYKSKAIPVGKAVEYAPLDVTLSKGDYDCTAYFNAIKDDGTYVGKAAAKITITVK